MSHLPAPKKTLALLVPVVFSLLFGFIGAHASTSPGNNTLVINREMAAHLAVVFFHRQISAADYSGLEALYGSGDNSSLWTGSTEAEARADFALAALANADADGLDSADYAPATIAARQQDAQAVFEFSLSVAVLRYIRDMSLGRVPVGGSDRDVRLPDRGLEIVGSLQSAIAQRRFPEFLAQLPPRHPEYTFLKSTLRQYRALAAIGGWPVLEDGLDFRKDGEGAAFDALRTRLALEDPRLEAVPSESGNADLLSALLGYQLRNGLEADGIVGRRTLAMLNIPVSQRIEQIIANMERWRWLPRVFEPRHVRINVADARLEAWSYDAILLHSKAIVGAPGTPTPILRTVATGVTLNPAWTIPRSIAVNEILPKLQDDPLYLMNHDMVILNGSPSDPHGVALAWDEISPANFVYQLRQAPGPNNPLGLVKLEMPNVFSVFLHDTPGKTAFAQADRALSHGCVRVEDIRALASFALTGDPNAQEALSEHIRSGVTQRIAFSTPLPVYILYWTVFANADGEVAFRPDVYGRDRRLSNLMSGDLQTAETRGYGAGCSDEVG